MGIFSKKEYDNQDGFSDYFNSAGADKVTNSNIVNAENSNNDFKEKPMSSTNFQKNYFSGHESKPDVNYESNILKLSDKGITQIAAINKIAKANGWVFSVEFPGNKVDMYFEGKNYKIFCRGVDYSDENHLPTGTLLATIIKKNTESYDQQKYIFEKEQTMITSSQTMITEDDIKRLRVEASEIRKNLDGLISGLESIDPKPEPMNIPVEEFGKKHKAAVTTRPETKKTDSKEGKTVTSHSDLDVTQKLETIEVPKIK